MRCIGKSEYMITNLLESVYSSETPMNIIIYVGNKQRQMNIFRRIEQNISLYVMSQRYKDIKINISQDKIEIGNSKIMFVTDDMHLMGRNNIDNIYLDVLRVEFYKYDYLRLILKNKDLENQFIFGE